MSIKLLSDKTFRPDGEVEFRVIVTEWSEGISLSVGRGKSRKASVERMHKLTRNEAKALCASLLEVV